MLRPLGVVDAILARGDASPSVRLHLGHREIPVTLDDFALAGTGFPHVLFEAQATVEAVLSEALAARGVEIERGAELIDVHPQAGGALARVRRAGTDDLAACCYIAGCDGPTSTVRRAGGVGWRGGHYRQEVVLADIELEADLAPGVAHAVAGPGGVLFLFALGERATWRLLATRRATDGDGAPSQPGAAIPGEDLQVLIDNANLAAKISDIAWSARVAVEHRVATRYRAGPVFLVGDAAHVHSPAGGQGMNTGIQDAANLGWKLAFAASSIAPGGPSRELLLDSYEAERRPVARRVVALTDLLFWGESGTGPVASFLRSVLVPAAAPAVTLLLRRHRLMATGMRTLSQLGVQYRRSPLSIDGHPAGRHGSRPGQRLADEPVTIQGCRRHLHELLPRPGVHLLLEHESPQLMCDLAQVHEHRIENWPGQGVVGVRPDGHVGYRSAVTDPDEIRRWLAMLGAY